MNNKLEIFRNNNFGEIRTLLINDEVWFVGKDIAEALGYKEPNKAITKHIEEDDRTKYPIIDNLGRTQETWLINESGLYSLILSSKLPQAKDFKRWVTNEVLPTLRKTGVYKVQPKSTMELLRLEFQAIEEIGARVDEVDVKVNQVQSDLTNFKQELTLLALDIERIQKVKNRVGVAILGGKEAPAYKDNSLRGKLYTDISRELKRQFNIETYKALKRNEADKAIKVIEAYKPPLYLVEEIQALNSQRVLV